MENLRASYLWGQRGNVCGWLHQRIFLSELRSSAPFEAPLLGSNAPHATIPYDTAGRLLTLVIVSKTPPTLGPSLERELTAAAQPEMFLRLKFQISERDDGVKDAAFCPGDQMALICLTWSQ